MLLQADHLPALGRKGKAAHLPFLSPEFLGHRSIDYHLALFFFHQGFLFLLFLFLKNTLQAAPMINYQLPNAPPLAISGKGMNYLETHPKREPTVKENFKGYLTISSGFPWPY